MKRNTRKFISIFLLVSLIVTSNSFISAAEVVGTMSSESVARAENLTTATISEATKIASEATPSEAVRAEEIDVEEVSEATPSEATPSNATPSNATPSNATPIEKVEFKFVRPDKNDIPNYYKRVNTNKKFYTFTDRNNIKQYRIFGYYEDASISDWYECNENGEVDTSCQFIDLDWEYYNQAPYIYESDDVTEDDWQKLYDMGYGDWCESEIVEPKKSPEFNSENIKIWHIYPNKFCPYTVTYDYDSNYFMYGHIANDINSQVKWYNINSNNWSITELKDYSDRNVNKLSISELEENKSNTEYNLNTDLSNANINDSKLKLSKSRNNTSTLTATATKYIEVLGLLKSTTDPSEREATMSINNGERGIVYFSTELHPGTNAVLLIVQNSTNRLVGYAWNSRGPASYSFTFDGSQVGDYSCYRVLPSVDGAYCSLNDMLRKDGITPAIEYSWRNYIPDTCFSWQATAHVRSGTTIINYNGNGADWGYTAQTTHNNTINTNISGNGFGKTYYAFRNWNTDVNGYGIVYEAGQVVNVLPSSSMVLYAQWNRTSSLVTFQNYDGTVLKTQEVVMNGIATAPPSPNRTGYTFTGWNRSLSNITDHTTITANYRANTYTVVYNSNGATGGSTAASSHSYDSAKKLTANGFSNKYYTFKNWNTKSDGSGTSYSNEQNIMNLTSKDGATITLYAQWTRSSSLVIFKDWDGSTLKEQEVKIGGTAIAPSPKRIGYTFLGWDKSLSNMTDHTIITAQYIINHYNFQLLGNDGTVYDNSSKEETVAYNSSFDQLLLNGKTHASRVGYTFKGWYTLSTGGNSYSYSGNRMPASDLEIYAQWEPNIYEVSFDSNHVRWDGGIYKESHTYDTELGILPAPEIYGWDFAGWWTEKNGAGEQINESSMVEANDVTYYGYWTPKTYQTHYISDVNHPSGKSIKSIQTTQTYDAVLGNLPDPEETGYTFTGWYDNDKRVYPETVFCPEIGAEDYTYRAGWIVNKYHIRLLGNHNSSEPIISEFDRIYCTKLGTLPEPEVPGYTFLGWFDTDGNQVMSDNWVEPHDVDYYAHWKVNRYTIHFDKNLYAIDGNPEDMTVTYDSYLGELPVLSTEGYTFLGWYTEPEDGEKVDEKTPVAIGDQTYYAHWKNNTFSLKLITENAINLIKNVTVIYDLKIGELPIPKLEDFKFRGWYLQPYSNKNATPSEAILNLQEGILQDTATPSEALRIDEDTVYRTATASEAYAYFELVFREEPGNRNRRCGIDGELDTDDDNFYFNGQDGVAGSSDDCKIEPGEDKIYGSLDDYYLFKGYSVSPGPGNVFGDLDDYMDLEDGMNLRPGTSSNWIDSENLLVNNGYDKKPGTRDDWIWESKELNIIRKSGPDGIFFTDDDELWWIGVDGIPGTEDDKLIQKGLDGVYGTEDDFIDNEDGTNTRAGADKIWGTDDDELWSNGDDGIPGDEDDKLIVSETNNASNVSNFSDIVTMQQVTEPVIPMYLEIIDDDDDHEIVDNRITLQKSALKQSNYEGLGGGVMEEITTLIPEENKETYKKDEIVRQLSVNDGSDNKTTFWTKLFNWFKENKKDVLAVLLLFLGVLVVLFEVSRRKQPKDKSLPKVKLPKTKQFMTKLSGINMSKGRRYSNRNYPKW